MQINLTRFCISMKYVLLLISAIVMISSCQSGMLNVNAISAKDIREHLEGIDEDQILGAFESLQSGGANNQWLQGIDEDQILGAFESLQSGGANNQWLQGIDEDQILGAFESLQSGEGDSYAGGFVLILVLFILLVIIGAGFGTADGTGGEGDQDLDRTGSEGDQELPAGVQSGGYIPLMTMEP
jgi:uncharacterized protein (TIGR01732 family)